MELFWLLIALFLCYLFAGPWVTLTIVLICVSLAAFFGCREGKKDKNKDRARFERKLKHCNDDDYFV